MKKTQALLVLALLAGLAGTRPVLAQGVKCADGTSGKDKAACTAHGGLAKVEKKEEKMEDKKEEKMESKATEKREHAAHRRTHKCKDGTVSHARKNVCSKHGGLA